jgi:aspartate/methionine/tyrosine aminotransferase
MLSSLVRGQIARPSPIRQIMKMAERQNILAMGLDPAQVISFGGGWVNHEAPAEFRQAYAAVAADADLFHKSGGYTATLGEIECREQIAQFEAHLFGVPRLDAEHIAIGLGSTQLTHDLFRTLLDPGDTVMLLDPTYANYEGQLAFAVPGVKIVRLRVLDPATWTYLPDADPAGMAREFARLFDAHRPRLVLFGAPDNPTSQVLPHALAEEMLAKTADAGAVLSTSAALLRLVAGRSPEPRRHPLQLEVGTRPGPSPRLDRGAPIGGRRDRACSAVQHPLSRHAVANDDGAVPESGDSEWIAAALRR